MKKTFRTLRVSAVGNLKNLLEMGHRRIYKGGYEVEIVGKNVVLRETSWNSQKGDFDRVVQEFSGIEEVLEVVAELGFDDWVVSELCGCWICQNILGQDEQGNNLRWVDVQVGIL